MEGGELLRPSACEIWKGAHAHGGGTNKALSWLEVEEGQQDSLKKMVLVNAVAFHFVAFQRLLSKDPHPYSSYMV